MRRARLDDLEEKMFRRLFGKRSFVVMAIIALALVIFPTVFSYMGVSTYIRDGINIALSPVQSFFTSIRGALSGYGEYFHEFQTLREENAALKAEINEMRDAVYDARSLEEMNAWLSRYLGLKSEHTDYELEAAEVTGRESGNYMTVFTLNKGTAHGVDENMAVITEDGVVGYVVEVGTTWCRAMSIIETSTSVGAFDETCGETCLLKGDFSLREEGLCQLTYVAADTKIAVGDKIVTSGLGEVYPEGLTIGYVERITKDEYGQALVAAVRPAVELDSISRVMIIKDFYVSVG